MLCIKTGMQPEYEIARAHAAPNTPILTGIQTVEMLQKNVPPSCSAIMSFGMCGGLSPTLPIVGQTLIASHLVGPIGELYLPDRAWNDRLYAVTHSYVQPWYSSGRFNEANTPEQRAKIYRWTNAWCIDDESLAVAQFAKARKIPFVIVRNVSDQWDDNVAITATLLTATGGVDPWEVVRAFIDDPIEMVQIGLDYEKCKAELAVTATQIGPSFQAP
jgi:hypothetical protein